MIISHGRRYIFVHIPKTGGTALTMALENRLKRDDIVIGDTPKAQRRKHRIEGLNTAGRLWKHSTLADIDGLVDEFELDDFFIFTMVRNPWDRIVSYYHWLRDQSFDHPAVELSKTLSFEDFAMHDFTASTFENNDTLSYLRDATGRARKAHFIRLEHVADDLKPVEGYLGFKIGPLETVNSSERAADYRSYYSDKTRDQVARFCASDIERFDYRF